MFTRTKTHPVMVGNVQIGGQNKVVIQSMCNIRTSKVKEVSAQINQAAALGAEIMRLAVLDLDDAKAIYEIKKQTKIPLVADIHFDYKLALAAIDAGIDAIRLNPGNIGDIEKISLVVDACKRHHLPIRIGVNSGSLDRTVYSYDEHLSAHHLVESAAKHVKILEDLDFHDIVISLKGTDVRETIAAYQLAANTFPYPLHLGITEAGTKDIGIIRSSAGLAPLLLEGIGDTIRISLSANPLEEVITAKRLLHDLGLYPNYPTFISCPTCGRTQVNLIDLSQRVLDYLETINKPITVAVMGCVVNGPGEASNADIGLAGGKGQYAIFRHGKVIRSCREEDALKVLKEEIEKL